MPKHQQTITDAGIIGSLADVIAAHDGEVIVHGLYDEFGAGVYDDTAAGDSSEIRELSRLVRGTEGSILELAAGSGRLTLPLTRLRREVMALERSAAMLDLLRDKATALPSNQARRLLLVQDDMSCFDLGRKFGSIVLGTASISLLRSPERRSLFTSVRSHLLECGRLWLSLAEFNGSRMIDESARMQGRSGTYYYLHNAWYPGQMHRFVGVYPVSFGASLHVSTSHPLIIDVPAVLKELRDAGLVVRDRHSVAGTWPSVDEYYLEIGIAND